MARLPETNACASTSHPLRVASRTITRSLLTPCTGSPGPTAASTPAMPRRSGGSSASSAGAAAAPRRYRPRAAAQSAAVSSVTEDSVLVEAAPGLATEVALLHELEQVLRHVGLDLVADGCGNVEPDEVEQRERAHRMAGAKLHAGVDCLRVEPEVHHAHGREQVREQQPVDHES